MRPRSELYRRGGGPPRTRSHLESDLCLSVSLLYPCLFYSRKDEQRTFESDTHAHSLSILIITPLHTLYCSVAAFSLL